MAKPYTFTDSIRAHDQAFYDWFDSLLVDYGDLGGETKNNHPILRVMATPTRAFAALGNLLVSQGFIAGADAEAMREAIEADRAFSVLPLPFVSITRGEARPDFELSGVPKNFRKLHFNKEQGVWEQHRWPGHYVTDYVATFWCHKRYTEAHIKEWLYSQLGLLGAAENEYLLPVKHAAPWGKVLHRLKFDTSSDNSDLEGSEPRWLRFDFNFSLRTWVFREPVVVAHPIDTVAVAACFVQEESGLVVETFQDDGIIPKDAAWQSANLFQKPNVSNQRFEATWPVAGNAKVEDIKNGLKITVNTQTDGVEIVNRPLRRDEDDALAIVSCSFDYAADGETRYEIVQRDPLTDAAPQQVDLITLPRTRKGRLHRFTVLDKPDFTINILGSDDNKGPKNVNVTWIDTRYLHPGGLRIAPSDVVSIVGATEYRWTALAYQPYLIIFVLDNTGGSPVVVEARNDAVTPTEVQQREVSDQVNLGGVFVAQPSNDSLTLTVPNGAVLTQTFLHPYAGALNGSDL